MIQELPLELIFLSPKRQKKLEAYCMEERRDAAQADLDLQYEIRKA